MQQADDTAAVWRGLTRAQVADQFDMRRAVPDGAAYSAAKRELSQRVRAALPGPRDVVYGPGPRQSIDIYPAAQSDAPILIFVHGGAWRSLDKTVYAFIAEAWYARGVTCVLPGYGLIAEVDLDTMVAEIRQAVRWTAAQAPGFGGDPSRIVLAGMSAGAQLSGMALADPDTAVHIRAAVLASGVYDLTPHSLHDRYTDMALDAARIRRVSPMVNPPARRDTPIVFAVGGDETDGFITLTREFHDLCQSRGHNCRLIVEPGRHHFSMGSAFGEPDSELFGAMVNLFADIAAS